MRVSSFWGAIAVSLFASAATAQSYGVVEQDTRAISLIAVESVTSPTPTTRRFKMVAISAWPELWQDSYAQISEGMGEVDCWNHTISFDGEPSISRDIAGNEIGQRFGDPVTWPISDGYEAYEKFLCENQTTVSVAPFRSLDEVKKYYFSWLNRTVPRIAAD